jgi:hypothetical protein
MMAFYKKNYLQFTGDSPRLPLYPAAAGESKGSGKEENHN